MTEQTVAKKSDLETFEMPERHTTFTIRRRISKSEMEKLKLGVLPQDMDDKWFCYFENGKFYVHRSWTGFCIYILSFPSDRLFDPRRGRIEVTVNRDPGQYGCTDNEKDAKILNGLLDWWTRDF